MEQILLFADFFATDIKFKQIVFSVEQSSLLKEAAVARSFQHCKENLQKRMEIFQAIAQLQHGVCVAGEGRS